MSDARIDKLAQFRIQQAQQALQEAKVLFRENLFLGTVNRTYYALFYAVQALVIVQGETISKHSGVIAFFDRVYIKPGIFPKDLSKVLHLAFDRRQANDYGEFSTLDQTEVEAALKDAEVFVEMISKYLQKLTGEASQR
jgi:uncharacterized protein (UPF0332 family)